MLAQKAGDVTPLTRRAILQDNLRSRRSASIESAQGRKERYVEREKLLRTTSRTGHAIGQTLALSTNRSDKHIEVEPLAVIEDLFQRVHKVHTGVFLLSQSYCVDFLAECAHQRFRLFCCQCLCWFAQQLVMLCQVTA